VLGELGAPALDPKDRLALTMPHGDATRVAVALASPLTAVVPRGFSPSAPDGTGAFRATFARGELVLARNPNAARGGAFLERIEVRAARDLADALRSFESNLADVGWLGSGLHRARPGAISFEGPELGWIVLRTGKDAGAWGAPGVAQKLLDRIPADRLKPLGVAPPLQNAATGAAWGGGAADLVVPAEALAPLLSQPAHPIRTQRIPRADISRQRADGRYALMLDFVRSVGPPGRSTLLALLAAANPELVARPPQLTSYAPVDIARGYSFGVVGALRVSGARLSDCHALETWQLGAVFRTGPR
jgi:peptide/nickel transport system substrate-binding protein